MFKMEYCSSNEIWFFWKKTEGNWVKVKDRDRGHFWKVLTDTCINASVLELVQCSIVAKMACLFVNHLNPILPCFLAETLNFIIVTVYTLENFPWFFVCAEIAIIVPWDSNFMTEFCNLNIVKQSIHFCQYITPLKR